MSSFFTRQSKTIFAITLLFVPLIVSGSWSLVTFRVDPQPSGSLTVMTYNIHEAINVNNQLDLYGILVTIQQADPDVLVLQEVDTGVIMSGGTDQARWLAQHLNMYLAPVTSTDHIWQSDVILSKYPILDYASIVLQSPSEDDTLLRADIEISGQEVSVYAVHFSAFSSADRRIQVDAALPWITSTPGLKIWAGDFNVDAYGSDPTDQGIYADITSLFNDSFTVAISQTGDQTWPSTGPVERIDYVFVTPTITVLSHAVPTSLASDHLPVVVQLQLP
ncbi:MAG: endonuclease/exonuclease/phosphatase family protein [Candidatus Hermodarchaeia archaeon]|jgi:endonuclease/exonuclease/phosphatase family metal-dependent hydrolase